MNVAELRKHGWPLRSWRAPLPQLHVFMGPMYSGKTSAMLRALRSARLSGAFSHRDASEEPVGGSADIGMVSPTQATALAPENIIVAKSSVDTRSPEFAVVSRDNMAERGPHVRAVASLDEIHVPAGAMVACDEAQFFNDGSLIRLWDRVRAARGALLVSGLDTDFQGRPFGDVLKLATIATTPPGAEMSAGSMSSRGGSAVEMLPDALVEVKRLVSKCAVCGDPASLTARVSPASGAWLQRFGPDGVRAPQGDVEPATQAVKADLVIVGDKDAYRSVCRVHHCGGQLVRASDDEDSMLLGSADGSVVFVDNGPIVRV